MKTCKECKIEYPSTTEYFYEQKNLKSGLRSDCKNCTRKSQLSYLDSMTLEDRRAMKLSNREILTSIDKHRERL